MKITDYFSSVRRFNADQNTAPLQVTLDPKKPGVTRIHLIPLKTSLGRRNPSLVLINGFYTFRIGPSWADLLRAFIAALHESAEPGRKLSQAELDSILSSVETRMHRLYPSTPRETILGDLNEIVALCIAIAHGAEVPREIQEEISWKELARFLKAPLRMDLIVSPMVEAGDWICPLCCKDCYAAEQPAMKIDTPLTTEQWKVIIDKCREAGIPQLTFTGGEPIQRKELIELIEYAHWHVTRLNTNGIDLTLDYARKLFDANLDGVQVTLYSANADIHENLVGRKGAWAKTVQSIKNALKAGLSVSVNTPLVRLNADYDETLKFIHEPGVKYASCSGLIPAGSARGQIKSGAALSSRELMHVMRSAVKTARSLAMDLSFTSPGWLSDSQLEELHLAKPVCGACLANMAVMPNGAVTACQSWLSNPDGFGSLLTTPWHTIWNHPKCRKMRQTEQNGCPLALTLNEGGQK